MLQKLKKWFDRQKKKDLELKKKYPFSSEEEKRREFELYKKEMDRREAARKNKK